MIAMYFFTSVGHRNSSFSESDLFWDTMKTSEFIANLLGTFYWLMLHGL